MIVSDVSLNVYNCVLQIRKHCLIANHYYFVSLRSLITLAVLLTPAATLWRRVTFATKFVYTCTRHLQGSMFSEFGEE